MQDQLGPIKLNERYMKQLTQSLDIVCIVESIGLFKFSVVQFTTESTERWIM